MQFRVCPTEFAPKDVARITGLTPTMQRDWRRNGYLPEREGGWSTFSLRDVAAITLRKTLADVPLGPAFANPIFAHPDFERVVDSIVWWALESDDSSWAIDGGGDELRADVARWVEDDRFDFIGEMAGVAPKDRGRVLTLLPMRGEILLTVEEFRADEVRPTPVSIHVYLDLVGRRIAGAAGRPLVTLVPTDGPHPEAA